MWMGVLIDGEGNVPLVVNDGKDDASTVIPDLVSDPRNANEIKSFQKLMLISENSVDGKLDEES